MTVGEFLKATAFLAWAIGAGIWMHLGYDGLALFSSLAAIRYALTESRRA
jgi:hypothetical protein